MEFKLLEFAKNEIRTYKVIKNKDYDIRNPDGVKEVFCWDMLIYKKNLKVLTSDINSGLKTLNQLVGKILKTYDLKLGDVIEVDNIDYRVTEILPRLYADFNEFTLEMMDNG